MSYRDEDYLAKKIAKETVKQQKEAYNKRLFLAYKITLVFVAIIWGFFELVFFFIRPKIPYFYLIYLVIIFFFFRKHRKA